jgi:hypothetical protein
MARNHAAGAKDCGYDNPPAGGPSQYHGSNPGELLGHSGADLFAAKGNPAPALPGGEAAQWAAPAIQADIGRGTGNP